MSNVLSEDKRQQVIVLGRLGWSLRKIQEATRVRRETISAYLRGAGVEIWPPGRWRRESKAKPAKDVITDFGVGMSGQEPENSKGAGSASTCEPYREIIEQGLSRDRNAMAIWQDLVSDYGFPGWLPKPSALRLQVARSPGTPSAGGDPHLSRRRGSSRLQQRADGAQTAKHVDNPRLRQLLSFTRLSLQRLYHTPLSRLLKSH
ncbi:MAG: putative transposase orfA for insertion sequence element [Acidobacteriaceae bacterium]|nr:putative transposase orfA for insertion sequence element [Acidobacteriaceae bacterium]